MSAVERVRKRPGMYIGDILDGSGFHRMLFEVLHNALSEALAGYCDQIEVELNPDGSVIVRDNGRGIPTGAFRGKPIAMLVMTELQIGGWPAPDSLGSPAELQGVGVAVVNALSEMLDLRIRRDGSEHHIGFKRGAPTGPVAVIGSTTVRGTEVRFLPDSEIFSPQRFDFQRIEAHVRSLAHLDSGAAVSITDRRDPAPRSVSIRV